MRRCKNWAHKIFSWKYLIIWRSVLPVFPRAQSASFLISTLWTPFRVCWRSAAAVASDLILQGADGKCQFVAGRRTIEKQGMGQTGRLKGSLFVSLFKLKRFVHQAKLWRPHLAQSCRFVSSVPSHCSMSVISLHLRLRWSQAPLRLISQCDKDFHRLLRL